MPLLSRATAALAALSMLVPFVVSAQQSDDYLVRTASSTALYYVADGGRYVFPDEQTYFSWFGAFGDISTVSEAELAALPIKGIVTYRPGVRLLKLQSDPKVYAVDANRTLRPVASEAVAASLYGSAWNRNVVDVSDAFFFNYVIGSPIESSAGFDPSAATAAAVSVHVGLGLQDDAAAPRANSQAGSQTTAANRDLLPDLIPFAPYDYHFDTLDGRTILRFSATFWNAGTGALELNTDPATSNAEGEQVATQRIYQLGGGYRDENIGTLLWHVPHAHYHYDHFGVHGLAPVSLPAGQEAPIIAQKTTFCLRDDTAVRAEGAAPRQPKHYYGCKGYSQGVSVGWADIYPYTLPDQYFDVTGLPAGTYRASFELDPTDTFVESRRDNNEAGTLIELDVAKRSVKMVGSLAPFAVSTNTLPDGAIITGEGTGKVYEMFGGRKRQVRIPHQGDTYSWPQVAIDVIPNVRFIRGTGSEVYMINDDGWRRRVLNPDALRSYGSDSAVVAPVSDEELNAYPVTDLVVAAGTDVFSISQKASVGQLGSLPAGVNAASVHAVSATDFASYQFPQ